MRIDYEALTRLHLRIFQDVLVAKGLNKTPSIYFTILESLGRHKKRHPPYSLPPQQAIIAKRKVLCHAIQPQTPSTAVPSDIAAG
eukprot:514771-Amphidinium_carterae.1